MTGDFSGNVQRRCFYDVLGAVAVEGSLGHPRTKYILFVLFFPIFKYFFPEFDRGLFEY